MQIWIGTSGFQYPEWKGDFYPETLSAAKMLAYYATRFPTTEVNYSFRHTPSARTIAKWAAATPAEFRFSFKAPQKVTHFAKLQSTGAAMEVFYRAILPMGKKLGPVLFQLPATSKKNVAVLRTFLGELPKGLRAAFEFRDPSWFDDEVFALLKRRKAALCIAEGEEVDAPKVVTGSFGYLRLRRDTYKQRDVARWTEFVSAQNGWKEAFVYFKHEERGVGPKFAGWMQKQNGRRE